VFEIAKELPDKIKISFSTMPEITAINAPGINFNFFKKGTLSQAINISDTTVITTDPN
jgi:hypothetical protein